MAQPPTLYLGPTSLDVDVGAAVSVLRSGLTVQSQAGHSHTHLLITGLEAPENLRALAVYLVGCVAFTVHANLEIRRALFDASELPRILFENVVEVIGATNPPHDDRFRNMNRDPWICEALGHLIIHLGQTPLGFHPPGEVLAKTQVKMDINDHGLDVLAIYRAGGLGVTAGECKAYLQNPTRAISDAAEKLSEIDQLKREMDIRAAVNQLRDSLAPVDQAQLASSFWSSERAYYPFICCDSSAAKDWLGERVSLARLAVTNQRKFLVPFSLPGANVLLDRLCDLARIYAAGRMGQFCV